MNDVNVRRNEAASRYEAVLDGDVVGFADYRPGAGGSVVITHTEASLEGRGIGGLLARSALDDLRERGLRVVPQCPFVARYIDRHPEYADLLA